jgi:hypothetical protein
MNVYTADAVASLEDGLTGTFGPNGAVVVNNQNVALIQLNPVSFTTSLSNLYQIAISIATATTAGGTPTAFYQMFGQSFPAAASYLTNSVSYLLRNTSGAPLFVTIYVCVRVNNSASVSVTSFNYNAFFF